MESGFEVHFRMHLGSSLKFGSLFRSPFWHITLIKKDSKRDPNLKSYPLSMKRGPPRNNVGALIIRIGFFGFLIIITV